MYCDKENVNVLTALMVLHGIRHVVVCPGSRNGVLVHNFNESPSFICHAVTDERSAAFAALGITAGLHEPAAVCVTSGSALLNTCPAVAEAYHRHLPLLVVSADRPPQWIGQQDGQTLRQDGALRRFTAKSVQLPEPHDDESRHWLERLGNEAMLALSRGPVHVNVPVSEPLFSFTTPQLPRVRAVRRHALPATACLPADIARRLRVARCPVLVVGQIDDDFTGTDLTPLTESRSLLVLPEILSRLPDAWRTKALEETDPADVFSPDLILHVGGTFVGKRLKLALRRTAADVVRFDTEDHLIDTFMRLTDVVPLSPVDALKTIAGSLAHIPEKQDVVRARKKLEKLRGIPASFEGETWSDLFVMRRACRTLPSDCVLHLANSNSIRNAAYFLDNPSFPVLCNRGVNGIEGSLSTAAGHSLVFPGTVFCFIGDLSFFYDQNALWNEELKGNLRLLLFNNGGGQIFSTLPGLSASPAARPYVAAAHTTSAEGIARAYGLTYLQAHRPEELSERIAQWATMPSDRPVLLEVRTTDAANTAALHDMKRLYAQRPFF